MKSKTQLQNYAMTDINEIQFSNTCILLYMVLATSLKKAYVRHFGELL